MKKRMLYTFCCMALILSCTNEGKESTASTDSITTSPQGQVTGSTDTAAHSGAGMMQIMMQMDNAMRNAPLSGDADRDFAQLMKVHHQSAVEMAELEVAQGADPTIKKMAQQMIADQQKEIAAFDRFLQSGKKGNPSPAYQAQLKASLKGMDHSQHSGGSVDEQFLSMMIPHHQGAIDMAKPYLSYAKDPELKTIAQNIIASQQAEITAMKNLQQGAGHQH